MMKKKFFTTILWPVTVVASKLIKLSVSSSFGLLKLSGIMVTVPLMGALYSLPQTFGFLIVLLGVKHIFFAFPLTLGLPTIAATLSWSCHTEHHNRVWKLFDTFLHVMLPLVCFIIFATHPVGHQAWWYGCYWLIPCIIWLLNTQSTFARALQSTFIAHALGSIIWLFAGILSAEQWVALIPIVAIERLALALASCGLYYVLAQAYSKVNSIARTSRISIRN